MAMRSAASSKFEVNMTIAEFKELMAGESSAEITAILKAGGFSTPEDIEGLKNKNTELLGKIQLSKKEMSLRDEKLKILDGLDLDAYNKFIEDDAAKGKDADLVKLNREIKRLSDENKAFSDNSSDITKKYHKELIKTGLSTALRANGYNQNEEILKRAYQGQATIEVENGSDTLVITGDDGLAIPAGDFFKALPTTEFGKRYLDKPDNKGSGKNYSNSGGASKQMAESDYNNLSPKEKASFVNDGGTTV